jgi:hypothetical protein
VVENAVTKVLADSPSTTHHRVTLVNKLVEALEHDAGWVELYGITGELNVPKIPQEGMEGDISRLLDDAKKVTVILNIIITRANTSASFCMITDTPIHPRATGVKSEYPLTYLT